MKNQIILMCNAALHRLGAYSISSLNGESSESELCRFWYPLVKKEVLSAYPFKASIASIDLKPIFNYDSQHLSYKYTFLLPANFIGAVSVNNTQDYLTAGGYLFCNSKVATLKYVVDMKEDMLDENIKKLISIKLAIYLCVPLGKGIAISNHLGALYNEEFFKLTQKDSIYSSSIVNSDTNSSNLWGNFRKWF